ncbi:YebC/PmpR family DNA-binding transcriptional regulator [Catalinimonas niigatensis]|uniref:YebC/PmpR family DNA-binding transcriptional regulator n=1 Tax=Catalinimonas niigatensis TaxID=1397264 RepID=UPI00266624F9|nr:YebC/PmpR family DNA-binding transcriptional regulator [Catalinimonas niigatensis]WPP49880.1 YebC/PmpR family DNA-binding transcriptional regulator [Catalinimonas niigatensis]
MAGHSKWANIKRRKGAQDARRAKVFTKLIKEITVSAKEAGPDPDANPRLRLAIQNAKGANMPKDTIERAITKGSDADAEDYSDLTYEGYAPHGVAVFVECTTDNLNRTVSSIRSIFTKNGGSLSKNGSVEFMFDRKGIFSFRRPEHLEDEDAFMLELIDGGAEEVAFDHENNDVQVSTAMEDFGSLQNKLEELHIETETAELQRIPTTTVKVENDDFLSVIKLIDALEDDDDVAKVYHNLEATEAQMEMI